MDQSLRERYARRSICFTIEMKRPTPSDGPLHLVAHVVDATDDRCTVEGTLEVGGRITATCRSGGVDVVSLGGGSENDPYVASAPR